MYNFPHLLWWSADLYMFCCSVAKSCLTLCDPMDYSRPVFLVLHHHPEFAQTHVHWVSDAIQPSRPLPPSTCFTLSLIKSLEPWTHMSFDILWTQIQHIIWQSAWAGSCMEEESKVWDNSQTSGSGDREPMVRRAWEEKAGLAMVESEIPVGHMIQEAASGRLAISVWGSGSHQPNKVAWHFPQEENPGKYKHVSPGQGERDRQKTRPVSNVW